MVFAKSLLSPAKPGSKREKTLKTLRERRVFIIFKYQHQLYQTKKQRQPLPRIVQEKRLYWLVELLDVLISTHDQQKRSALWFLIAN